MHYVELNLMTDKFNSSLSLTSAPTVPTGKSRAGDGIDYLVLRDSGETA